MTYAFDTLKFTQRLEQVGVGREQAEAHAELARDMILADVATKADLRQTETAIGTDISSLRTDLASAQMELKTNLASARTELKNEISTLKLEVGTFRKEFEGSLRELELRMTVKLGAIIAAAVAVVAALQKFSSDGTIFGRRHKRF